MSVDISRAFEISEYGIAFSDEDGVVKGYIVFGDTPSPVGLVSSGVNTLFIGSDASLWANNGPGVNDWQQPPNTGGGGGGAVSSVFGRTGAVVAVSGDYNASQITNTPAGSIAATTAQAAIDELDSEKVPNTRTVSAGAGLTGGGDLSANRTISMPNVGTAGTYGTSTSFPIITTDAQGRVSNVTTQALPNTGIKERLTGSVTNTSNSTYVNITGLTLNLVSGKTYKIVLDLVRRSASNTNGVTYSFNGGTCAGTFYANLISAISATGNQAITSTSISAAMSTTSSAGSNLDQIDLITIVFACTTSGTFIPQFRSETNGTLTTIQANSIISAEDFT